MRKEACEALSSFWTKTIDLYLVFCMEFINDWFRHLHKLLKYKHINSYSCEQQVDTKLHLRKFCQEWKKKALDIGEG